MAGSSLLLHSAFFSGLGACIQIAFMAASAIVSGLFGCYGTAAVLITGFLSSFVHFGAFVDRPERYLYNNEMHSACMLVAAHANASSWYLFIGDRDVVDNLLNKPMTILHPNVWLAAWFDIAHIVQLMAMTYVTAQQDWDGVCMVLLMLGSAMATQVCSAMSLVEWWLQGHDIAIDTQAFRFSSRMQMVGAIHLFNGCQRTA